jgi:RHS repeat-associated protein
VDTSYQYSADGDLVRATDLGRGSAEMRYDPIGQLLALVPEEAKQELFHFDVCGNVFEADDGAPPRSYGKGNRLLAHGDTRLVWDDDGRLVEKWVSAEEVWRYSWNGAGKLSEVEAPNGDVVRFGYDAFARRVTKEVHVRQPGGANVLRDRTRFVWDGEVLAHEVKERSVHKGDPVVAERTYVFEDDSFEPVAHKESGAWYHYVNDPIGTPERLLDAAGNVAGDLRRSAWGKTETDPSSESTTPIRFAGQYADEETGLSYNFFRYYDPETAQYIQRDPIGLVGGLHAYAYAPNPFLWIDPLGLAVNTPNTGVVYLRTDPVTGKQYVGKSKSKEAYERRKKAHDRKKKKGCAGHPGCDFQELETGIGGEPALSQAEEDWIRVGGGPGGRPGQTGPLENKVHGQASDKYNGNIPFP